MRKSIFLLLAVALASAADAKPREVRHLAPSSRWVVNYANESCSLGRNFGEGDQKVTLFFDQYEPGDSFSLTFVGKPVAVAEVNPKAVVQFGPNEEPQEATAVGATTDHVPALILQGSQRIGPMTEDEKAARKKASDDGQPFEPAPIGAAREKAATWLELGKARPFDLVFETGALDAPLAALRECSWDMVRSWGLDVQQQKSLSRRAYPTVPPYSWFSPDDYPSAMLRGGYQGIVNFRLLVDETGKVAACKIQVSTRPKEFDDVVCRAVTRRAKFHPALDSQGKPILSYWRETVSFRLAM